MKEENRPYEGILCAGIMLTRDGPKLIEYNCRFGDPEAQVLLPLLETDIIEIILKSINKKIKILMSILKKDAINVVLATRVIPENLKKYQTTRLIPSRKSRDIKNFSCGNKFKSKKRISCNWRKSFINNSYFKNNF